MINSHVVGTGQHGAMQGAGVGGGGTYGGVPQQLAGLLDTAQRLLAETTGAGYGQVKSWFERLSDILELVS